jgi:hypothetical protein
MDKKKIRRILIHNIERRFDLMFSHTNSMGRHFFNYYGKKSVIPISAEIYLFLNQYFPTYGRFEYNIVKIEQPEDWLILGDSQY